MTVHLTLSGLRFTVNLNLTDSTEGESLWLRPVSAETLTGLLFLV